MNSTLPKAIISVLQSSLKVFHVKAIWVRLTSVWIIYYKILLDAGRTEIGR